MVMPGGNAVVSMGDRTALVEQLNRSSEEQNAKNNLIGT
jgi:hypothetical protein